MIELGALGSDADGYGIYRIQDPEVRDRLSNIVPITEFDAARGIEVNTNIWFLFVGGSRVVSDVRF